MKRTLPLLLILLSGCATVPKYNYQSQASNDPTIIFGDRFGGGSVTSPARSFTVNTKDAAANKCADSAFVGVTSNHWMKASPATREIKVPAGNAVSITSFYMLATGFSNDTCSPPILMFTPKEGAIYSVDIEIVDKVCTLSVMKKLPDEKLEKVADATVLPACKD